MVRRNNRKRIADALRDLFAEREQLALPMKYAISVTAPLEFPVDRTAIYPNLTRYDRTGQIPEN